MLDAPPLRQPRSFFELKRTEPEKMIFRARILPSKIFVAIIISLSWCTLAWAQEDKVHSQVLESVENEGHALVLVGLNVPWKMEQTLNQADLSAQRQAIRAAQDSLVLELSGTDYRIVREYQKIPGIALEIGPDALSILKKSNSVTNVWPDRPIVTVTTKEPIPGSPTPMPTARKITTQSDKVPAELFQKAKSAGTVLVLVGLKAPWRPEGPMSEEMVRVQRKAIAAAQNYLLVELGTTQHRVTRLYERIPGIALEVGLDALKVLAKSAAVTNVLPDRAPRPAR
jgi:hypothetical protein